jgi:hypothetical protein
MRVRFDGEISGVGTTEGTRIVVGRWLQSPFGTFADVMVERADGHRVLLAPATPIADFVAATYAFDEVRVGQIELRTIPGGWHVSADDLELTVTVGARTPLGWLLRAVPPALARAPAWAATVDPLARRTMSGVRTRGSAGQGRREWYAALDSHRIDDARAYWGRRASARWHRSHRRSGSASGRRPSRPRWCGSCRRSSSPARPGAPALRR